MKKIAYFLLFFLANVFVADCQKNAIGIDFKPQEGKNNLQPGNGVNKQNGEVTINGATTKYSCYQLECNTQTVFTVKNLSGDIGVLTVQSLNIQGNCEMTVQVSLCSSCDINRKERPVKPGESMTEIFDLNGHTDDMKITIKCSRGVFEKGCLFNLDFSAGTKFDPKHPPPHPIASKPISSTPNFGPTPEPISGNPCTTKPMLIKTVYLDVNKKNTPLSISFIATALCDCVPYNVYVSNTEKGQKLGPSASNKNGVPGNPINIKEPESTATYYFWAECAGGKNPPCKGDVTVTISGKGK